VTLVLRAASALVVLALGVAGCSAEEPAETAEEPGSSSSPSRAFDAPSSTGAGAAADLDRFYGQKLKWRKCGDGFQCTRVTVPLDYTKPKGRTIKLSVNRLPAESEDKRKGSLLLNPGGPGGSGLDYARAAESVVSGAVRDRFDIVGFDPRGVGKSTPIDCLNDEETDALYAADGSPDTPAEERRLVALSKQFGQLCAKRSGELLAHVGTRDAARDLDVLRAVLGDKRLYYLGKSYGTYLGATYAELFPTRVGALVLDGALDPSSSGRDIARAQAIGFEVALRAFVDDCRSRRSCPLPRQRSAALDAIQRLFDAVDRRPLSGDRKRRVTQAHAVLGVAAALYDQETWPLLRDALREARRGDGSTLLLFVDYYTERDESGNYRSNANDALYAVNCIDRPDETDVDEVRRDAAEFDRVAPRFGAFLAWGSLPCAFWPHPPQGTPHKIRAPGAPPILVVGTLRDPATPYVWSESLAAQLESGRLLSWNGDGHTAYGRGSRCIDRAVDAYLIEGKPPRDGTKCD
jgi:pimeloyl-ACP methyl ester carboxylesterase